MIKQSQQNLRVVEFKDREIATLQINQHYHLRTESKRIAVKILDSKHRQFKVMSWHRRIAGQFQGDQLNKVGEDLSEGKVLGKDILIEPKYKASKEVLISFLAAVAKEINRGSITAAQRRK
jgi:hypothetical protein